MYFREYIIGEIMDNYKNKYTFFNLDNDTYFKLKINNIMQRIYMNLRDFFKQNFFKNNCIKYILFLLTYTSP